MDEKKDWLKKVLNDASADVESWPNWMKDSPDDRKPTQVQAKGDEKKDNSRRRGASA